LSAKASASAGGVGGLLSVTKHQAQSTTHYFPTFDGNGNVSEYLDAGGAVVAHYEYDPFGRTTFESGPNAADFAYRFSTKPVDPATGLYYYGLRYFDPLSGRWINRDPIGERGGVNLYGMVANAAINFADFLGLDLRPGGAVANVDQIPAIMRKKGFTVAATTMERWFSRRLGEQSVVDDILTIAWAEKYQVFNDAVTDLKARATNVSAAASLKNVLDKNGLLVTGQTFDHTVGKASAVEKFYFQSAASDKHTEDDFGFAVGAFNLHLVAKGKVTATEICVSELGYYIVDPYRFNEIDKKTGLVEEQRLGVWDFNEMEYEGYLEAWLSTAEFLITNQTFIDYQLAFKKGSDFIN
jgi:RHS repeat-associated protein